MTPICSFQTPRRAQHALVAPALLVLLSLTSSSVGQAGSASESMSNVVSLILQTTIPREYDGQKNWGHTRELTVGVRLRREGLLLETERRRKTLNDGLWTKYQVRVAEGRKLKIDLADVHRIDGGEAAFILVATAPLIGHADVMRWTRGIRLLSIGVDCEATVRLRLEGTVGLKIDGGFVTPAVAVEPRITTARLELVDFRLTRLGGVERHVAHEIGEALEGPLRDRLAKEEPKLVERLNRSIAKHADELRVSGDEFLKGQWDRIKRKFDESKARRKPATHQSAANLPSSITSRSIPFQHLLTQLGELRYGRLPVLEHEDVQVAVAHGSPVLEHALGKSGSDSGQQSLDAPGGADYIKLVAPNDLRPAAAIREACVLGAEELGVVGQPRDDGDQ